jgi:molybdate transport system permease protein
VRTDPLFYSILGVIGGTYVLLIVGMLLADGAYMFTSDISERVILDFSADDQGKQLRAGDTITGQYATYGLAISTHDPANHPARLVDSDKPSASNSNLGTPNQEFGGPGVGAGGRKEADGENNMPLGKVLVIGAEPPIEEPAEQVSQFVANWVNPVDVQRVVFQDLNKEIDGEIVAYAADGSIINQHPVRQPNEDGSLIVEINDEAVSRLDVTLPQQVAATAEGAESSKSNAVADIEYKLMGSMNANLTRPGREMVRIGTVRVVPTEAAQIRPADEAGSLLFTWSDPVQIDEIHLLDIDVPDAEIAMYDIAGKLLSRWAVEDLGPNSIQEVALVRQVLVEGEKIEINGEPGVARMEVRLPNGGAVAQLNFTWASRVRTSWERDHPRAARLFYNPITMALQQPEIQYSIRLTLISCTMTAILSLWVAIPIGYLMSRHNFFGRNLIDAILDIPIVLPPLVVGLSLLILFQFAPVKLREAVVYEIPAVILAQFSVACAFAVRTMRATFDHIDARHEQVALTLGCSRAQAFGRVVLPEAKRGVLTAATLAWARSLGEFGPLLIFAGTTRYKTEVLSTTVFLELNNGNVGAAVAVSLIMVAAAIIVLVLARAWGTRSLTI